MELTQRFYNEHRSSNTTEAALVNFVKNKYANDNIVDKVIKIVGFPRWDKILVYKDANASLVGTTSTSTTYYIPLVIDSQNFVNATIAIHASTTDTTLTYLQDWQYQNLQNNNNSYTDAAESYAVFFMRQSRNVFGYNSFKILDSNLFRFNNHLVDSVKLEEEVIQTNNLNIVNHCVIATFYHTCGGWRGNINGQITNSSIPGGCTTTVTSCNIEGEIGPGGGGGGGGNAPSNPPSSSGSTNTPGGATGWVPTPTGINYLTPTLSLTPTQVTFLNQHPFLIDQLFMYNNQSPNADKITISNEHIIKLMTDPSYLLFCQNQSDNSDSGLVWWDDEEWLSENNYTLPPAFKEFYEYARGLQNKKPVEFANICDGLQDLATSSENNNGAEQLGYVTVGTSGVESKHFIKTDEGSGTMVGLSYISLGGQLYYYYPLSKGWPTLSYPLLTTKMINGKQFIIIPIRASVHTHHYSTGEPLTFGLSPEDKGEAKKTEKLTLLPFNNFVIQVNDGLTFSTAEFYHTYNGNIQSNYVNIHDGIMLAEICTFILP